MIQKQQQAKTFLIIIETSKIIWLKLKDSKQKTQKTYLLAQGGRETPGPTKPREIKKQI